MTLLNTFFNYRSSVHNRSTAHNTAATAAAVDQLASADRARELRERALITYSSTPAELVAVEHRLAAQMRARIELEGNADRQPYARAKRQMLAGGGLFLLVLWAAQGQEPMSGATTMWLIILGALFLAGLATANQVRKTEALRDAVIAEAVVHEDGHCFWCGEDAPHALDGEEAHPRVFHAVEIEAEVGT